MASEYRTLAPAERDILLLGVGHLCIRASQDLLEGMPALGLWLLSDLAHERADDGDRVCDDRGWRIEESPDVVGYLLPIGVGSLEHLRDRLPEAAHLLHPSACASS